MQGRIGEKEGKSRSDHCTKNNKTVVIRVQVQRKITLEILLLSYTKPILSAEQEETLLISVQECSSMADTSKFRTPRRNHLKPIAVPGEMYITEFEKGY